MSLIVYVRDYYGNNNLFPQGWTATINNETFPKNIEYIFLEEIATEIADVLATKYAGYTYTIIVAENDDIGLLDGIVKKKLTARPLKKIKN
jgi:hypothetical protein